MVVIALFSLTFALPLGLLAYGNGSLVGDHRFPVLDNARPSAPADTPTARARAEGYLAEARGLLDMASEDNAQAYVRACRLIAQARLSGSDAAETLWQDRCKDR